LPEKGVRGYTAASSLYTTKERGKLKTDREGAKLQKGGGTWDD